MTSARYSFSLAIALLFVLMLIGFGIRKQAYQAVARPIYDPLRYIHKGKSVWSLVAQADVARILNARPTLRPPGSVPFVTLSIIKMIFDLFSFDQSFRLSSCGLALSVYLALRMWIGQPENIYYDSLGALG